MDKRRVELIPIRPLEVELEVPVRGRSEGVSASDRLREIDRQIGVFLVVNARDSLDFESRQYLDGLPLQPRTRMPTVFDAYRPKILQTEGVLLVRLVENAGRNADPKSSAFNRELVARQRYAAGK